MKNILADLTKKLEEAKKILDFKRAEGMKMLEDKRIEGMKKLEDLKIQFSKEIDQQLGQLYKKQNLVKEAFKQKFQLRKIKIGVIKQLITTNIRFIITIPFIYGMIIPTIIFHICLEIYHRICFPLYGAKTLKASNYFVFDRHHLSYLNGFEKLNCVYCSYFNCLIAYAREIAAYTELYWCPIKHAKKVMGTHDQYHMFVDYLEGEKYRKKIVKLQTIAKKGTSSKKEST